MRPWVVLGSQDRVIGPASCVAVVQLAASVWLRMVATVVVADQEAPPLVEVKASSEVSLALSTGTMTVPFGCTTGWPPMPVALLAVRCGVPQVAPPSVEVDMYSRLPSPL